MRTRTKEIKIRLNEKELEQLNKQVEKSIFNREEFIRMRIAEYEIQEKPDVEISQFMIDIRNIAGALNQMHSKNMFKGLTREELDRVMELVEQSRELEKIIYTVYFPYYKEKQKYKIPY